MDLLNVVPIFSFESIGLDYWSSLSILIVSSLFLIASLSIVITRYARKRKQGVGAWFAFAISLSAWVFILKYLNV